jgi:hypothetical protein
LSSSSLLPAKPARSVIIPEQITRDQLLGTMIRTAKWTHMPIAVCWENQQATSQHFLDLTRLAVHQTWEASSAVRFVSWGRCISPNAAGIHITISDEQPHTDSVGRYLDMRPHGMTLNFTFKNWRQNCQQQLDFCASAIVAHEFGHALGFTHEQRAPNAPAECSSEPNDIEGDYLVTRYDFSSIMSLCNPKWNGNGKLSELDVQSVRTIYGA